MLSAQRALENKASMLSLAVGNTGHLLTGTTPFSAPVVTWHFPRCGNAFCVQIPTFISNKGKNPPD